MSYLGRYEATVLFGECRRLFGLVFETPVTSFFSLHLTTHRIIIFFVRHFISDDNKASTVKAKAKYTRPRPNTLKAKDMISRPLEDKKPIIKTKNNHAELRNNYCCNNTQ